MRAFVAGATGWTGRHVVEALVACDVETVAHVRPDSPRLEHWKTHFGRVGARFDSTAWDPAAMGERLDVLKPDLVFGLLGTTRRRRDRGDGDYEAVDYGLTVMLMDACCREPAPRFVYLSSLGAGPGATSPYMSVRWRVEERLRESGMRGLVVRPSLIIGDRDEARSGEAMGAWILDRILAPLRWVGRGDLADRYGSIHGKDLGRGIVAHALRMDAPERVIDSGDVRPRRLPLAIGGDLNR